MPRSAALRGCRFRKAFDEGLKAPWRADGKDGTLKEEVALIRGEEAFVVDFSSNIFSRLALPNSDFNKFLTFGKRLSNVRRLPMDAAATVGFWYLKWEEVEKWKA